MGSKARFSKELLPILTTNNQHSRYVEPFAGGMNMICSVPSSYKRYANDSNIYLIAMFKELQKGWIPPESVTREFYELCKAGECEDYMRGYVGFNCSYSGKYFGGYAGLTKTKTGVRDYQKEAFNNVMKQQEYLKDVVFSSVSYLELKPQKGALIYCDPPYAGTTKYKDDFDHAVFWDWVREISKDNSVFVSEYTAPDDFECLWEKQTVSSLSANGKIGGSKASTERLFKYIQ